MYTRVLTRHVSSPGNLENEKGEKVRETVATIALFGRRKAETMERRRISHGKRYCRRRDSLEFYLEALSPARFEQRHLNSRLPSPGTLLLSSSIRSVVTRCHAIYLFSYVRMSSDY